VCYDTDATPPVYGPPVTLAAGTPLSLISADATRFAAFLARPERPSGVGVLVLPDNRGLSRFYEQLTMRLAEQGHPALAVDYFGRTAGTGYRERGDDFTVMENLMTHLSRLTRDGIYGDIDAGIAHLRAAVGGDGPTVVSLGFCMGGRFAFLTAASRFRPAGVIGLYGYPDVLRGAPGPTQHAAELTAPILGLFAGADEAIPSTMVDAFAEALTEAGVPHSFVTYPGAPHSFFEMEMHEYAEASADAWRRILAFLKDSVPLRW
jgi:carboxymethylenebutenolidase